MLLAAKLLKATTYQNILFIHCSLLVINALTKMNINFALDYFYFIAMMPFFNNAVFIYSLRNPAVSLSVLTTVSHIQLGYAMNRHHEMEKTHLFQMQKNDTLQHAGSYLMSTVAFSFTLQHYMIGFGLGFFLFDLYLKRLYWVPACGFRG